MEGEKTVAQNKKARFQYHIEDSFEAGMVLVGSEVKAIREGRANISEGFCGFDDNGDLFLRDANISVYSHVGYSSHDPVRPRKLLMHKRELIRLKQKVDQKGYTLVPLRLYFRQGRAKLQIGLGKGKKLVDKRQDEAKKDAQREIARHMKR